MAIKQNDETSVIFYKSFQDMINRIRDGKVRAQAYDAIFEYAFFGREPETDNDLVWMVFLAARPQIDANSKRRENGKKGGRKAAGAAAQAEKADAAEAAWQEPPAQPEKPALICLKTSGKQKQKNRKPNVNDNGNGNENENENENGNGNETVNENANGNQNGNATAAADHHHHPDHSRIRLTADDKTEQPPGGDSGAEPRGAGGDAGRSGEPQTIFCYSREQFPTNQCELQKVRAYTEALFQRYHKRASEEDVENVFLRTYRRMELADGAIAAFDAERAELLAYAFEQAAAADKLNWRYINGMYRNFDQRDITTVSDALQYELERSRRFG